MTIDAAIFEFRVRRIGPNDAEQLSRFYTALPEESRYFFEPYRDTTVLGMRAVIERSVSGTDLSFIAVAPDCGVIAHFFFMDVAHEVPHLGIGLSGDAQGVGLGGVFMAYLVAVGRHVLKKKAIGLTVVKTNERAIRLYKRHGFQIVREDVTFRSRHDSYEMRLDYR